MMSDFARKIAEHPKSRPSCFGSVRAYSFAC